LRKFKLSSRPRALLTRAEADAIYCSYWNTTTSAPKLAAAYGIGLGTVKDIIYSRTWKAADRVCPNQGAAAGTPARPL
jgi:hypothetical protein